MSKQSSLIKVFNSDNTLADLIDGCKSATDTPLTLFEIATLDLFHENKGALAHIDFLIEPITREDLGITTRTLDTQVLRLCGGFNDLQAKNARLTEELAAMTKDRDIHSKIRQRHLVRHGKACQRVTELTEELTHLKDELRCADDENCWLYAAIGKAAGCVKHKCYCKCFRCKEVDSQIKKKADK